METLAGQAAFVTGASRGIGRGIALAFARAGVNVAINYRRDLPAAERTAAEICTMGRRAEIFPGDVADPTAVEQMLAAAGEAFRDLPGGAVMGDRCSVMRTGGLPRVRPGPPKALLPSAPARRARAR